MTVDDILAVAEFLGDGMNGSQADRLIDAARQLSIADRERLYASSDCIWCSKFYTALSENSYELGWRLL